LITGHLKFQGRQSKDLPPLLGQPTGHLTKPGPTGRTLLRRVGEDLIRLGHLLQGRARMIRLPTRLFARSLPQRAGLFGRAVTRRRLTTVAAIDGKAIFQLFNPSLKLRYLLLLLRESQVQLLVLLR
jgi:hypothetical protein